VQVDVVALNIFQHNVAAGKIGIELQRLSGLAWGDEEKHQTGSGQHHDRQAHEWELPCVPVERSSDHPLEEGLAETLKASRNGMAGVEGDLGRQQSMPRILPIPEQSRGR